MRRGTFSIISAWETHWPKIVAAVGSTAVAIGALALYINLPTRVAAGEKKLEEHEKAITKLAVIEEQNNRLMTQQTAIFNRYANPPATHPSNEQIWNEEDPPGVWWYCQARRYEDCWEEDAHGRNRWQRHDPPPE